MFLEKYMIIERCYGCRHVRVPLAAGLAGASQAGRRFDFTGHAGLGEVQWLPGDAKESERHPTAAQR